MTDRGVGTDSPRIRVLGGTGDQRRGLALRLAMAGTRVRVGSRSTELAVDSAADLGHGVAGCDNRSCAELSDAVIAAVRGDGYGELLESLQHVLVDKGLIDCVNPLGFEAQGAYVLPVEDGSAVGQAQRTLPGPTVVGPFQNAPAQLLLDRNLDLVETDVLVLGDDRAANDAVQQLVNRIPGMRGIYGGRAAKCGASRGAHGQPHLDQPTVQGARRCPSHRRLMAWKGAAS